MRDAKQSVRGHLLIALVSIMGLFGTVALWSTLIPLDGAIVSHGVVEVENSDKKVQHQTGGIVGQLNVKENQHVEAGAVVLRLDDTATRANLAIVINELNALRARVSRLQALRDGSSDLIFPKDLVSNEAGSPAIAEMLDSERRAFSAQAHTRDGQREQLKERIEQINQEIGGLKAQNDALDSQLAIATNELADLNGLNAQGLVQRQRITSLRKEISSNEGSIGDVKAKIAEAQGKITETRLQILQVDRDSALEAAKDLRDAETRIGELKEKKTAAEDQLARVELRAPISGFVHELSIHTVGGVIGPGETVMTIVPDTDGLVVEARVAPTDIDQIQIGQETRVRFSAFNQRTTPEIVGHIYRVAADVSKDPQSGQEYFRTGISFTIDELRSLRRLKLVPGMPAEAYIKTGERTLANYLLKPVYDQMQRAMRED